jgi:hypothetical protein
MSSVSGNVPCPVCKKEFAPCTPEAGPNYFMDCRTGEQWLVCGDPACGYCYSNGVVEINGKLFWKEEIWFPMDKSGKVLRPKVGGSPPPSDDSDD